ncbi:MAG: LytTR family DNA-binding domain-containing protein [Bacteroidota bacterium]
MIKAVIIDDERQSRNVLRKMLVDFCEEVSIIGEAKGVRSGIELLQQEQPDLILLDIEMSDGDGFDILNAFDYTNLNVIFVTGYDQYAIKAIKYAALDYLLKPVDLEELQLAIERFKKGRGDESSQLRFLHQHYEHRKKQLEQIVLPGRDNHIVVALDDIIRIEAMGSYVMIHLENGNSHLVVNSLSYYEALLPPSNFFRIHKSHLINLYKVSRFASGRKGKVLLKDNSELGIAARRKSAFSQIMKQLGKD